MRGTAAENNLRAKTDRLARLPVFPVTSQVPPEKPRVFDHRKHYPDDIEPRTACIDPIAVLLASFAQMQ